MKTILLNITFLFFGSIACSITPSKSASSKGNGFFDTPKEEYDTSDVNLYTRRALKYLSPLSRMVNSSLKIKTEYIKANIDTAESICEKENIEFPSMLHLARAEYFFATSDYKSASQEASIAVKKSKNNGENEILARTLNFLGRYCLRTGFFVESIDNFAKSTALAKKYRIKGIVPGNFSSTADVYDALGKYDEWLASLQSVIDAAQKENDTTYLEDGYFRLGTAHTDKVQNFSRADSLLRACLKIASIKEDTSYIVLSLSNLGWNYYLNKNYNSAIKFYNSSLKNSIPAKRYSYSSNSFGNLGTIYRDMGDLEKSISYYKKSIDQAKIIEDVYNLSWVYKDMSDMYLRKRDTSNAFNAYVLHKKYSDSMILKNNTQGLTDARVRYEADAHNKEVELLSLRVSNQKILIYACTGLFILSVAIAILLLSRAKINTKRRISEMNRKISEITQANLRQQMNPHFIFNTLNSIQYYMYQHDKLATNNYLTKFSSLMRKVLENSQHTSVPLRDELDALNLYLDLEMIRFKDKFNYEIKVDEEIDTILYKVPTMLIQPYVENSICHGLMPSEGKGLIKINIKLENKYISCVIEDNGIGREAAQDKKRNRDNNHNSLGTLIVSSRLDLVNALYGTSLKTIYTDLKNIKGEPEGTMVEIQIPIMT
jgi:tetratricopeptide (TPR) repeat protein